MSLHQLHFNKSNIRFGKLKNPSLPPTCDSIIRNLLGNPRQHLDLLNKKNNITHIFEKNTRKKLKIKKLNRQLVEGFIAAIEHCHNLEDTDQLINFLEEIDCHSAKIDGFYTMQPVVVQASSFASGRRRWTLLENQQRIRHIYMALKYLEKNRLKRPTSCKSSTDLLNKHFLKTLSYANWDNYLLHKPTGNHAVNHHLGKIYQVFHNWFSQKTMVEQEIWKKKLLNHTKFIWYIAEEEVNEPQKYQKQGGMGFRGQKTENRGQGTEYVA